MAPKSRQPGRPAARRASKLKQPGRHRRNTAPVQRNRRFAAQDHAFRAAKSSQQGAQELTEQPNGASQGVFGPVQASQGARGSQIEPVEAGSSRPGRPGHAGKLASWTSIVEQFRYGFKFTSKPYRANLRTKQIVIDIMKLFENWGSNFFRRCYPSPF